MLKKFITILLLSSSLFAQNIYEIKYNGIKVGDIKDLSTIKNGYLQAEATSYLKFFVWYDKIVIYKEPFELKKSKKIKYKKDSNNILDLLQELQYERPKYKILTRKKITITIQCENNRCTYQRKDNKTNKISSGIIEYQNNILQRIYDEDSGLSIDIQD